MHHNPSPLERAIYQAQMEAALPAGERLAATAALVLHNSLADIMTRADGIQATEGAQSPERVYLSLCRRVAELLEHPGCHEQDAGRALN